MVQTATVAVGLRMLSFKEEEVRQACFPLPPGGCPRGVRGVTRELGANGYLCSSYGSRLVVRTLTRARAFSIPQVALGANPEEILAEASA